MSIVSGSRQSCANKCSKGCCKAQTRRRYSSKKCEPGETALQRQTETCFLQRCGEEIRSESQHCPGTSVVSHRKEPTLGGNLNLLKQAYKPTVGQLVPDPQPYSSAIRNKIREARLALVRECKTRVATGLSSKTFHLSTRFVPPVHYREAYLTSARLCFFLYICSVPSCSSHFLKRECPAIARTQLVQSAME